MELRVIRLQDPAPAGPVGERRRRLRHKLNTAVYASFNGPSTGMVLDLSELVDLSEDGFAVQSSERLEVNRPVSLCLDLPETRTYIQGSGQVVWTDGAGRGGIRFSRLPDHSQRQLKEWLFVNLLIAATNHAARAQQASRPAEKKLPATPPALESPVSTPVPDLSGILSAVEAVRREVHASDDLNAALTLVAERALSLTGASGAALALLTDDKMICRARAGEPAPPLGARVDVKHGLSGECVRGGRRVACDDTEADPRVDREVCREMGIGSIMAAPIVFDFRVVGLLEVFSSRARAFTKVHETALERLAEIVPKAQPETVAQPIAKPAALPPPIAEADPTMHAIREALWEPEREAEEPLKGVPVRLVHLVLLVMTAAALALVSGYLLAPRIEKLWQSKPAPAGSQATVPLVPAPASTRLIARPKTLDNVRKLAEQGDADAQWDMGARYRNGQGVPQDDEQAVQWFQRAAEQGHLNSQMAMGASYWSGRGIPRDLSKAYFWSVLAANQGDETSASRMQGLALQMTRAEVAAAQQQADDWLRQHQAAKAAAK